MLKEIDAARPTHISYYDGRARASRINACRASALMMPLPRRAIYHHDTPLRATFRQAGRWRTTLFRTRRRSRLLMGQYY